jgi:hypothetical protein
MLYSFCAMGKPREFVPPLAYRIWSPQRRAFSFTSQQQSLSALVDRWTGLFDKQGSPLFEHDIITFHYDWKLGWVRALVVSHPERTGYAARLQTAEGTILHLGFYYFADSYLEGNLRQHPAKLKMATEQFSKEKIRPWWLSGSLFTKIPRSHIN